MKIKKSDLAIYSICIITVVMGLIFRYASLKFISLDMQGFVIEWYEFLFKKGVLAFKYKFSDYAPFYTYMLFLATKTYPILSRSTGIKLIGLIFDLYSSYVIYLIARMKYEEHKLAILAGCLFFILPTIMLNSSYWGQADGIYTAFLLTSFLFILKKRPGWAMLFFALAFCFKLQAIFFIPFLAIMTLDKRLPVRYYIFIPATYILLAFPTVLVGRSWNDIFSIYLAQTGEYGGPSINAPTLFILFPTIFFLLGFNKILIADSLIAAMWLLASKLGNKNEDIGLLSLKALASVTLIPFIMPSMHERYFYSADAFSFVVAIFYPRFWFLPLFFQISSYLVYSNYLFESVTNDYQRLLWASIINAVALISILFIQFVVHPHLKK